MNSNTLLLRLIFGIAIVILAWQLFRSSDSGMTYLPIKAKITDILPASSGNGYRVLVTYSPKRQQTFRAGFNTRDTTTYAIGDTITVQYNPKYTQNVIPAN
ncbi:MAG: hypothetical protein AAF738_02190 [Bacteroidota bacterium]